jgi:hypothetical protein
MDSSVCRSWATTWTVFRFSPRADTFVSSAHNPGRYLLQQLLYPKKVIFLVTALRSTGTVSVCTYRQVTLPCGQWVTDYPMSLLQPSLTCRKEINSLYSDISGRAGHVTFPCSIRFFEFPLSVKCLVVPSSCNVLQYRSLAMSCSTFVLQCPVVPSSCNVL